MNLREIGNAADEAIHELHEDWERWRERTGWAVIRAMVGKRTEKWCRGTGTWCPLDASICQWSKQMPDPDNRFYSNGSCPAHKEEWP